MPIVDICWLYALVQIWDAEVFASYPSLFYSFLLLIDLIHIIPSNCCILSVLSSYRIGLLFAFSPFG